MIHQLQPDLYQVRGPLVCSYVLIDEDEVCLIDSGFVGGLKEIESCLKREQLAWKDISSVLITHGHLDHCYNLSRIQDRSRAKAFAHPLDSRHIAANYPYHGISRICGFLEFCGRTLFGYSVPQIDHTLSEQQVIPFAGGIRVIHTPGHTAGHCCFFWEKHNLLFAGDLFATGHRRTFLPPAFLNSCPENFPASLRKILNLNPAGMLSNHCNSANAALQRERFFELANRELD